MFYAVWRGLMRHHTDRHREAVTYVVNMLPYDLFIVNTLSINIAVHGPIQYICIRTLLSRTSCGATDVASSVVTRFLFHAASSTTSCSSERRSRPTGEEPPWLRYRSVLHLFLLAEDHFWDFNGLLLDKNMVWDLFLFYYQHAITPFSHF